MEKTYKYHFIYHIRILIGKKKDYFYVGKHSTDNIDDGYCGSGTVVEEIISKYRKRGYKENKIYKRTIITWATSEEEAYELESVYVDKIIVKNKFCLNVKIGGKGGMSGYDISDETRNKLRINTEKSWGDKDIRKKRIDGIRKKASTDEFRENNRKAQLKRYKDKNEREKTGKAVKKHYEDPQNRERQRQASLIALNKPETKKKLSDSQTIRWKDDNEREKQRQIQLNRFYGENGEEEREKARQKSLIALNKPETKKKLSDSQTIRWKNKDAREKQRQLQLRRYNDENGEEEREKARIRNKKRLENKNERAKCGKANRGKISITKNGKNKYIFKKDLDEYISKGWSRGHYGYPTKGKTCVNNGVKCVRVPNELLDEFLANNPGWVCGMLKRKNKGQHWYNNGIDESHYFEGEQPEGWVLGRLLKKNAA